VLDGILTESKRGWVGGIRVSVLTDEEPRIELLGSSMEFRPFQPGDDEVYVRVRLESDPSRPFTVEQLRFSDSKRAPDATFERFLILLNGETIGALNLETPMNNPEPDELDVVIALVPAHHARVDAVFAFLLEEAARLEAKLLRVNTKENFWQYAFFLERGFTEFDRMWESYLELGTFDETPFRATLERAGATGLEVRTFAQHALEAGFVKRYYDALIELLHDVPTATPFQPWSFEMWQQRTLEDPNFLPEANFIGFVGGDIAGVSQLFASPRAGTVQTGLTGVRRGYRHQGIAFTLKLEATRYAKAQGFERVRTVNHVVNRPMLAINEAMGYVKEPATVMLRKTLEPGQA
jgi:GNAT superfamily N-acetyltransferase